MIRVVALSVLLSSCPCAHRSETVPVTVLRVVDGDTVDVQTAAGKYRIRLLGIDCPESHRNPKCRALGAEACAAQVPLGKAATLRAEELLAGGAVLETEWKLDRYHRTLGYLRLRDGRDFGLALIMEGTCEDYSWKYDHPRAGEYRAARRR